MKFLYIVQAKSGLPKNYESIADRTILISWQTKTSDSTLFLPDSTWTTGRNAGLKYVKANRIDFDYLIFLDGDLYFDGISNKNGFEQFENFLKNKKPLIGLPTCWGYNTVKGGIPVIPKELNSQGLERKWLRHQPVDWFDAAFNAFSKQAVKDELVLPYDSKYDEVSWYTSQFLLILKANQYYKGKVLQFNRVRILNASAENKTGADYPRAFNHFGEVYKEFLTENGIEELKMTRLPRAVEIATSVIGVVAVFYNESARLKRWLPKLRKKFGI